MDHLFDFLLDVTIGGLFGLAGDGDNVWGKGVPNPVRWVLLVILAAIFLAVFGFLLVCGVLLIKTSVVAGLVIIFLGLLLAAGLILRGYSHFLDYKQADPADNPGGPQEESGRKEHE